MFGEPLYWRATSYHPRFFFLDGRVVVIALLFLMHMRVWTAALLIITIAVLVYFDRKGISPEEILRFLRSRLVGRRRTARGLAAERAFVDFGFETQADVDRAIARFEGAEAGRRAAAEKAEKKKAGRG